MSSIVRWQWKLFGIYTYIGSTYIIKTDWFVSYYKGHNNRYLLEISHFSHEKDIYYNKYYLIYGTLLCSINNLNFICCRTVTVPLQWLWLWLCTVRPGRICRTYITTLKGFFIIPFPFPFLFSSLYSASNNFYMQSSTAHIYFYCQRAL